MRLLGVVRALDFNTTQGVRRFRHAIVVNSDRGAYRCAVTTSEA